ncbi:sensor histidine kinase [Ornithinimicrobium avium]|uniref:histidine kinase n=1 Tax=Ornithinimicrobium avium TaxID=2283195 RepID=A0A345NMU6_9MICO|nr:HAMP domain-containing sensor histidine kinase [Ornithinimicrobium avium]AXH96354.1 sensor histidine kinase [Ornithinimicrobium avium]
MSEAVQEHVRRSRWGGWSVRQRLLVLIVLVMTAGLTVVGAVNFGLQYGSLTERVDAELQQEVSELGQMAQRGPAQDGRPYADVSDLFFAFLTTAVAGNDEAMMGMVEGEVEIFSGGARTFEVAHEEVQTAARGLSLEPGRARVTELRSQGTQLRMLVADVRLPLETRPARFVVVKDIGQQRAEIRRYALTYGVLAVLVLGAVAGLAHLLLGRLLRPLTELRAATAATTTDDLSRRVDVSGADTDVAELVVRYNEMLDRIEAGVQQQRQFLDDAAHELRTPLTIVRGNAELLSADDPQDVEATRRLVLGEVDRMQRLVDDLLMLARVQRPDFLRTGRADVTELTVEAMDRVTALGERTWRLRAGAEGSMRMDRQRVLQAVVQLAANAVKFSEPGSAIELSSAWAVTGSPAAIGAVAAGAVEARRYLVLSVHDEGIGIPDEQQERVFERFARADNAGQAEGSGLGLAIVRVIAEAHGGAVGVASVAGEGSTFWLALPDGSAPA